MDLTFWFVFVIFLIVSGSTVTSVDRNNVRRLKRLERKVDLILSHLGLDPNHGENEKVSRSDDLPS